MLSLASFGFSAPAQALSGSYCGSVPFIIDNKVTFNADGTSDLDINVKIAHKEIKCSAEATSVTATSVTFPKASTTGDCMGDAVRTQKKDPTKYFLDVNSDGTLTFHSDGYPGLKMKACSSMAVEQELSPEWREASAWARSFIHSGDIPSPDGAATASEPCCQGACSVPGQEKYYSIAKSIFGAKHCGECCMDPKAYPKYHLFEKNLTKATSAYPCHGFGYGKYDSTVTHGFGPVKMTLDLYDPSSSALAPSAAPTGKFCGSVPFILDNSITFNSDSVRYTGLHRAATAPMPRTPPAPQPVKCCARTRAATRL